jgi:hypothetical protein
VTEEETKLAEALGPLLKLSIGARDLREAADTLSGAKARLILGGHEIMADGGVDEHHEEVADSIADVINSISVFTMEFCCTVDEHLVQLCKDAIVLALNSDVEDEPLDENVANNYQLTLNLLEMVERLVTNAPPLIIRMAESYGQFYKEQDLG